MNGSSPSESNNCIVDNHIQSQSPDMSYTYQSEQLEQPFGQQFEQQQQYGQQLEQQYEQQQQFGQQFGYQQ